MLQTERYLGSPEGFTVASGALQWPAGRVAARLLAPRCRYCGEPSIWPWGGQQVCARCEAIRCRIEQAAAGWIGDDSLYLRVVSALAQREHYAAKVEHQRRRRASSSPWAGRVGILLAHGRSRVLP